MTLLTSCATPTAWRLDTIATGDPAFDSTRLSYHTPSNLRIELLRIGQDVSTFLSLRQHRFAPSPLDPSRIDVTLVIDGQNFHDLAPSREGRMRLKLSKEMTEHLTRALQEGREVDIVLDGFQETISPQAFKERYEQLTAESWDLMNFIKGPFG